MSLEPFSVRRPFRQQSNEFSIYFKIRRYKHLLVVIMKSKDTNMTQITPLFLPLYTSLQSSDPYNLAAGETYQPDIPTRSLTRDASIVFRLPCPSCGKMSDFSFGAACQHRSKKTRRLCGWRMPTRIEEMNSDMVAWICKHTNQPTGQFNDLISYTHSTGAYLADRHSALTSGDVYFDGRYNDFCLYLTPSGTQGIATACSGCPDILIPVSGVKVVVNSSAQNLHHHYANYDKKMIFISKADEVVIEPRNREHPSLSFVFKAGKEIACYDSHSKSLNKLEG
jgi:hypothetical protein